MNGNSFLIDTSIVIEVINNSPIFVDKIKDLDSYVSAIILGELYIGVNRVADKQKHLSKVNRFLATCEVFDVDGITAINYGEIVARLYKKGKPIPQNDSWIAATAIQHGLTLITKDKHFTEVEGLQVEFW